MLMRNVLLSVIVPVYNVENYVSECIASIVAQEYRNLEIILVDDGSTDGSGAVCDEWAKRDQRIRVIHMAANVGVSGARNTGIQVCTGDLIGFVDADDWIEKDMYMCLSEACENADMAACGWISYPAEQGSPLINGRKEIRTRDFEEAVIQMYWEAGYFTSICNKLFRRNAVMPDGHPILLEQEFHIGEDELWLIQVMKNCETFSFVPKPCYHYRSRIGSATRTEKVTDKRMSVLTAKRRAIQELSGYGRAESYAKSALYIQAMAMMVQCFLQGEKEKQVLFHQTMKPLRKDMLKRQDLYLLSKLKMVLPEMEMSIGLPAGIVRETKNLRRHRY